MQFSIIIPTLNEADTIETCLKNLINDNSNIEIIVADGGSSDGTLDIVSKYPHIRSVNSAQGKGRQMNEGASEAKGDIFIFLHSDTSLPSNALRHVEDIMSDRSVTGGSFCLSFDMNRFFLKFYSIFTRINHTLFTYGDQCLFVRSHIFKEMGGFRDIPIMEDVEIQTRLRRIGKFLKIRTPVVTSARRYMEKGIIWQQVLNTVLVMLYHMGVSPSFLKRYYN
jgi:rSAM/selenodomain-associated transferase 2